MPEAKIVVCQSCNSGILRTDPNSKEGSFSISCTHCHQCWVDKTLEKVLAWHTKSVLFEKFKEEKLETFKGEEGVFTRCCGRGYYIWNQHEIKCSTKEQVPHIFQHAEDLYEKLNNYHKEHFVVKTSF